MMLRDNYPFISVIVPARNEERFIGMCLQSLINLEYPSNKYEIIIVDNGSTDRTYDIALQYTKLHTNIKIIQELENFTCAAAKNRGIYKAKGEIFALIDADAVASPQWLRKAIECMDYEKADIVGGAIKPLHQNPPSWWEIYDILFAYDQETFVHNLHFTAGVNTIAKKIIFDRIGLFNPKLRWSEDLEWGQRAYAAGAKIVYCPEAIVYHAVKASWKELSNRAWKEGFYWAQTCREQNCSLLEAIRWRFWLSPGFRAIIRRTKQKGCYRHGQILMALLIHNTLKLPRIIGTIVGIITK